MLAVLERDIVRGSQITRSEILKNWRKEWKELRRNHLQEGHYILRILIALKIGCWWNWRETVRGFLGLLRGITQEPPHGD